ncbi:cubilin-like [Glandiceps talaboti]
MTPLYPSNYPNDVNCKSHVTSLTNQIGIYFLDFNLEQDFDLMNISVENGRGEIVNLINQYSGNVPPPNVTVPFKNITLDFSSDEMFSERGYWIRFKAISPDITTPTITTRQTTCGEDYNIQLGDVVYLTSPNYPRKYDNNLDCLWTFSATSRALLHIHFTSFGTEQNYDFIEVGKGNGPDTGIKLLNTYSGYFTPANITTSSPNAWITFHSDDLLPDSGFEVYVTAIPDLSTTYAPTTSTLGCSEDFFLPAGEEVDISTPNFPNNYASNLDCLWTFTTVDDTQLYISFLSFNSESIYDYVEAGDGLEPHSGETLLARHSGGSTPDDIVSEGSSAWITFHSDGSMVGRGFEATIAAVQGDDFGSGVDGESSYGGEDSVQSSCVRNYQLQTGQSVKLTSPNYPSNYDSQLDCIWTFSSTDGATLHVAFDSFDTETNYDFLEAGEGSEPLDAFKIIDHHSGRYIPVDFSASPSVWIRFHSDATITSKGFEATISAFQVLDPVTTTTQTLQTFNFGPILLNRCHRDYTLGIGDVVHVTSPSYPGDYANNLDCLWTFSTNRGSRLEVRFLNFDTEFGHDYLETGEGTEKTVESVLLRRQSGHIVPNDFTTQTTSVWISFHSDNSASNKGFEFTVTAVQHIEEVEVVPTTTPTVATTTVTTTTVTPTPVGCVRSYSLQIGETIAVTSPNYPMNYDNSLNCVWTFSTVDGAHLVIRFISFQTEQAYDYLDIGEGLNHLDLSMTTLRHQSGSTAPSDITTTSPNAWITFTSDTSINSVGFEVNITAVQPMAGNDAFTTTTKPVV